MLLRTSDRGVGDRQALLAAQMGVAAFGQAFAAWLDDGSAELDTLLAQAFRDVHNLSSRER